MYIPKINYNHSISDYQKIEHNQLLGCAQFFGRRLLLNVNLIIWQLTVCYVAKVFHYS